MFVEIGSRRILRGMGVDRREYLNIKQDGPDCRRELRLQAFRTPARGPGYRLEQVDEYDSPEHEVPAHRQTGTLAGFDHCDGMGELRLSKRRCKDIVQPVLPLRPLGFIQRDAAVNPLDLGESQYLVVCVVDRGIDVFGDQRPQLAQASTGRRVDVHGCQTFREVQCQTARNRLLGCGSPGRLT